MLPQLSIVGIGAVTPVGLTALQTCAAIRARLSGFGASFSMPPPLDPIVGARVPAGRNLKRSPLNWLVNLAARAISECMHSIEGHENNIALLIAIPDRYRNHPAFKELAPEDFLQTLKKTLGVQLHPSSTVLEGGHAAAMAGVAVARKLLAAGVEFCIVGGVDSLLNRDDIARLATASRLHDDSNPQGLIPGEAAGFVVLSAADAAHATSPLARILGIGLSTEQDTVLGEKYSTAVGLRKAVEDAVRDARCDEAQVSFRVSDMNGERYRALESLMYSTRYYRTRRASLPVWYPAASLGDVGAASGALTLIIAAVGLARGYAAGPIAVCEASSDQGLRAACVVATLPGSPIPPFRSLSLQGRC